LDKLIETISFAGVVHVIKNVYFIQPKIDDKNVLSISTADLDTESGIFCLDLTTRGMVNVGSGSQI